jgi:hypothetical protein
MRSIVRGASGRTSSVGGGGAFLTSRCGLLAIRPDSSARCRIPPSKVSDLRVDTTGLACGEAVGLPAPNHLRRQFAQPIATEPGRDVPVVQARVQVAGLACQRRSVDRRR